MLYVNKVLFIIPVNDGLIPTIIPCNLSFSACSLLTYDMNLFNISELCKLSPKHISIINLLSLLHCMPTSHSLSLRKRNTMSLI